MVLYNERQLRVLYLLRLPHPPKPWRRRSPLTFFLVRSLPAYAVAGPLSFVICPWSPSSPSSEASRAGGIPHRPGTGVKRRNEIQIHIQKNELFRFPLIPNSSNP